MKMGMQVLLSFGTLARFVPIALFIAVMAGCASLPSEGPLATEITEQSEQADYVLVNVDARIVSTLSRLSPYGLRRKFGSKSGAVKKTRNVVGVGDVLSVGIWEAGDGGLFNRGNNGNAQFPAVVVNKGGNISLPYTGNIKVVGLTPSNIQDKIVKRLEGKAIQPQAVVNVVRNENNAITLSGDVANPGRYELSLKGDRIVDIIAKAGGTRFPARETYVTFIRDGQSGVQLLDAIMDNPEENIEVRRHDQVFLTHDPKRYTVLGAVSRPGVYTFDSTKVNVLEAVANAGGLIDERADSTGLFVFRYEDTEVLSKLGVDVPSGTKGSPQQVPTIYRINMRHAQSYFYAQSFRLDNKDSVFVSNTETVQIAKLFRLFNLALSPGITAARVGVLSGL